MEVEAVDEGTLGKILVPEGTEGVAVNTPIACSLGRARTRAELATPAAAGDTPQSGGSRSKVDRRARDEADPAGRRRPRPRRPHRRASDDPDKYFDKTVKLTVREALRDAMAEEMRRDDERLPHGRGSRRVPGRLQGEPGPAAGIRRPRASSIRRSPSTASPASASAPPSHGPAADRRVHDLQLRHAGDRPHHQLRRQDALHVRRPDGLPDRVPRAERRRVARRRPALARTIRAGTPMCPGLKVVAPYSAADAKGLLKSAIRDPNPVVFLEHEILYGHSFDVPEDPDFIAPIGRAKIMRAGKDVTITAFSFMVGSGARRRRAAGGARASTPRSSTCAPSARSTSRRSSTASRRPTAWSSVEEGWPFAGIGAEIVGADDGAGLRLSGRAGRRGSHGADVPMPYAANLEKLALPSARGHRRGGQGRAYRS